MAGLSGRNAGGLAPARRAAAPRQRRKRPFKIGKDYEFLVLFTSTPGFPGDIRLAEAMKDANPKHQDRFRRTARHHAAGEVAAANVRPSTSSCRKEFDYAVVEYANGKPLEEILGVSYLKDGKIVHNPDRPQIADLDALPARHRRLQARSRCHAATTFRSCFIRSSRCTPRADARRSVRSACGRRL